jgi:hypothetical protein
MSMSDHLAVSRNWSIFETAFAHEQSRGFNTPVVSFGASTSRPFSTGN